MQTGNWYFFAIVLDGKLNRGSLQIDYSYGYNNGTIDFKVRNHLIFGVQISETFLVVEQFEPLMHPKLRITSKSVDELKGYPIKFTLKVTQIFKLDSCISEKR